VVVFDVDHDDQITEFVLFEFQNQSKLVIEADGPLVLTVSLQFLVVKALEMAELTLVGDCPDDRHLLEEAADNRLTVSTNACAIAGLRGIDPFNSLVREPEPHDTLLPTQSIRATPFSPMG
jgi:hypothetical protein